MKKTEFTSDHRQYFLRFQSIKLARFVRKSSKIILLMFKVESIRKKWQIHWEQSISTGLSVSMIWQFTTKLRRLKNWLK